MASNNSFNDAVLAMMVLSFLNATSQNRNWMVQMLALLRVWVYLPARNRQKHEIRARSPIAYSFGVNSGAIPTTAHCLITAIGTMISSTGVVSAKAGKHKFDRL